MALLFFEQMELTSIDYARLIQYAAQKLHMVLLNKTQINKILFYVYGVYYAETGKVLFEDDSPKVWPYGPVFPRVNKRINTSEIISFDKDTIRKFNKNTKAMVLVRKAVDAMYDMSAVSLTKWSHQEGAPWYNTLYIKDEDGNIVSQKNWNTPIELSEIESYFSNPKNLIPERNGK